MTGRNAGRSRRFAVAAVVIYAVFLAATPFEHHDLICHLKTPQHCTSCASSAQSTDPHTPATLDAHRLADAGRAVAFEATTEGADLAAASSGRSPPPLSPSIL
jgi:hypothetical protein